MINYLDRLVREGKETEVLVVDPCPNAWLM